MKGINDWQINRLSWITYIPTKWRYNWISINDVIFACAQRVWTIRMDGNNPFCHRFLARCKFY